MAVDLSYVEAYEALHKGNAGDLAFYLNVCKKRDHVLELGMGFGRIFFPLKQKVRKIYGLDSSQEMIDYCVQQDPNEEKGDSPFFLADMSSFQLPHSFDKIIIPFNSLYCLPTQALVKKCFQRCYKHLKKGGMLLFDVYKMEGDEAEESENGMLRELGQLSIREKDYHVLERVYWKPTEQKVDVHYQYVETISKEVGIEYSIEHHYLYPEQIVRCLWESGFSQMDCLDGFPKQESEEEILVFQVKK